MKMFDNWRRKKEEAPEAGIAVETPAPVAEVTPPAEESESVSLELGDFLHRIPAGLLKEGETDPKRVVRVEISELAKCITSGRSTTGLERLFRKTPGLFRPDAPPLEGVEIIYPWQKILRLVTQPALGEGPSVSVQHLLAEMKRSTEVKAARASAAESGPPRGTVQRMREAGRTVSWMSVQKETRRAPAAGGMGQFAPAPRPVEPEAAREIPIRVETPPPTPTVLRMPDLSLELEAPSQRSGLSRNPGLPAEGSGAPTPDAPVIPDLAPPMELKLATMPDLAPAEETPAPPPAPEIPDLALSDDRTPTPIATVSSAIAASPESDLEDTATIHFPSLGSAMPDLAFAPEATRPAGEMPDLSEAPLETVVRSTEVPASEAGVTELRASQEAEILELEAARESAASQKAEAERQLANFQAERERDLAALREQHTEAVKRHQEERAALERKVAEFIELGDAAVRERDAQIAAQRDEITAAAKVREEILTQERVRAEASAEAARAESLALLEQAKSAAALESEHVRAELLTAKDELFTAAAARDAEKAIAESELGERDQQIQWKDRAIEGLEADVETYRNRIKVVLKQRDQFAEEKKQLMLQFRALEERLSGLATPAELRA